MMGSDKAMFRVIKRNVKILKLRISWVYFNGLTVIQFWRY